MASNPPNWDGSTEEHLYVPPHRGSSLNSLLEETGEAEEVREMVRAKQSADAEFCPKSHEAPELYLLLNSVHDARYVQCLRRELAALRRQWMREALRDLLDTLERFDVPHYHEGLPNVHCAGCWQGLVLRELRERIGEEEP
jgi:hypothetical protein